MNDSLDRLAVKAKKDPALKERIYKTREEKNPLTALCNLSTEEGFSISPMELVEEGEEFCAAMLRSVNGGGVDAPDSWNDTYELFFASLEE